MKIIRTIIACPIILLFTTITWAQTADDIINRYVKATGRKDGLKGVNTILMKRSAYNPDTGITNYHTSYLKRPNMIRLERSTSTGEKTILAYDGKEAWRGSLDPATGSITKVRDIPPESPLFNILFKGTSFDNNFDGKFIDYSKKGSSAEFLGKEMVDGKEMYHIKMVWEDGGVVEYHFDVSTGLIWKHWEKDERGRTHSSLYLDYRKAGNILIPYSRINKGPLRDNPEGIIKEEVLEVKMNVPLNDSLFKKPVVKEKKMEPKEAEK